MNYKPPLIKQEVEFKWRVRFPTDAGKFLLNAKKLGSKIGPPKYYSIHDYYFDTANHFFSTTHTKCRLRKINQRWQLTLKSSLSFHQGLARRLERTTKLPKNLTKQQALQISRAGFFVKIIGNKKLIPLFEIKNSRITYQFQISKKTVAEASMDRALICRNKETFPFEEIELEFVRGNLTCFKKFANQLTRMAKLKPTKFSKVSTALKAFHLK